MTIFLFIHKPDIDECATNPCNHGSCQDKINGYHCNCEPGYTGTNCDTGLEILQII